VLGSVLKKHELYKEDIIREIIKSSSLDNVELPEDVKKVFVTAYDISPDWHIKIQSVFQKHVDNAISKTVNFPKTATIEEIKNAFMRAYELGCKGVTVYREGSLDEQVINIGQ